MTDVLICLGIIVLVCFGFLVKFLVQTFFDERRTKAWRKAAEELGLEFQVGDDEIRDEVSGFQLSNYGRSRILRNVLSASTEDVTIRLFDYTYTSGTGELEETIHQTVALIHSPSLRLPPFHAMPEKFLEQLSGLFGYQDIDFNDCPAFSRAFMLQSPCEAETRNLFDQSLLEFFASMPNLTFESLGNSFMFYDSNHSVKPKNLGAMLEDAYRVFGFLQNRSIAMNAPLMSPYLESEEANPLPEIFQAEPVFA